MIEMRVMSGPRHFNRQVKRAKSDTKTDQSHHVPYMERCEPDSHTDTLCAKRNCRLLSHTGQCCDVRGFRDDLSDVKDVPVPTVATAISTSKGGVCILVFNEVLYFGDSIDQTLINPNQIHHYSWIACQLEVGTPIITFVVSRGPVSTPRPVLDSSAQTTQVNVLVFFVKPNNGFV